MSFLKPTHFVVTAGYTDDGAVAYMRADGSWTGKLNEAAPWPSEAEADAKVAVAKKQERLVCDPYAFGVLIKDGGVIDPMTAREAIRANGPTTPMRPADR